MSPAVEPSAAHAPAHRRKKGPPHATGRPRRNPPSKRTSLNTIAAPPTRPACRPCVNGPVYHVSQYGSPYKANLIKKVRGTLPTYPIPNPKGLRGRYKETTSPCVLPLWGVHISWTFLLSFFLGLTFPYFFWFWFVFPGAPRVAQNWTFHVTARTRAHGHMDGHTGTWMGTRAHGHTGTRAHGHWSPSFGEAAISRDGVGGICVCRSRADCAGGRAVSAGGGAQCARGAGVGVSVGVGIGICIGFAPTAWNWCGGAAASDAGEVCTPWGGQAGGG